VVILAPVRSTVLPLRSEPSSWRIRAGRSVIRIPGRRHSADIAISIRLPGWTISSLLPATMLWSELNKAAGSYQGLVEAVGGDGSMIVDNGDTGRGVDPDRAAVGL